MTPDAPQPSKRAGTPLPGPLHDDLLLTLIQAARLSGISETSLRRVIAAGKMPVYEVGRSKRQRIRYADLKTYIASLRRVGT